jgi:ABC-type nitrate/sulfonate/bicarbonate transport system substrate-binding protein
VAKELGFFAKRCIEPNIIQFEGGASATASAAAAQGSAIVSVSDVAIGRGMKVQQFWGLAPRMPQAYMVSPDVKTAADLKGKKLSATGGGVGGFNWRMGREILRTAGLTVDDAHFSSPISCPITCSTPTAPRSSGSPATARSCAIPPPR